MTSEREGFVRFISEQPLHNLLDRRIENELIPAYQHYGVGIIPYAPLAQGVLAGRYADAGNVPADSRRRAAWRHLCGSRERSRHRRR